MLMAHEYIESRLMDSGMPYLSPHPEANWDPEGFKNLPGADRPDLFGAHEVAPNPTTGSLMHWKTKLGLEPPTAPIADDLSNVDDFVRSAQQQLRLKGWTLR